jgi:thiamine-monophosphate kinase
MTEASLIARITARFPSSLAEVGIGDDGAVLRASGRQVVTSDMLVENVDFTRATPLIFVGRKSLAVNLSDLAAMGASPSHFVLSMAIPEWAESQLDAMLDGMSALASASGIELIGGDLSRSELLVISITATGTLADDVRPLLRSGARPGNNVYLSRPIGASASGLALLQNGWTIDASGAVEAPAAKRTTLGYAVRELAASLIRRHVDPDPELRLGAQLAAMPEITSCIDVSDGLSTDLHHLCSASAAGATIEQERIPVYPDLLSSTGILGLDPRIVVLHGGEEYALLFTSTLRESELSARLKRPVYRIGRITSERDVILLRDGVAQPLIAQGFEHFA